MKSEPHESPASGPPQPAPQAERHDPGAPAARAAHGTVTSLFEMAARLYPERTALDDGQRRFTYAELAARVARLANVLAARGVGHGTRVALLAENRIEYPEVLLAAGRLGAIVACQNWRMAPAEIEHCLDLVEPDVTVVSERHAERIEAAGAHEPVHLGEPYERLLARAHTDAPRAAVHPEDPLLVLYTSGTTGLPKGAVISHRAEIVRNLVTRAEFGLSRDDTFAAWSPLYHMGAAENTLGTLMVGGKVIVVDGFDQEHLAHVVAEEPLGWLLLMPGMVGAFAGTLERMGRPARGVKVCGVMADLVPPAEIARITRLLDAPYANTFGATETGCPPCSSNLIAIGVAPTRLAKEQSAFCEVRLVGQDGTEARDGTPGELWMRGPTLFSGYWRAPQANAEDFRDGWFHMGDVFVRNPDGTLDFVDRVKYLIKSGGENIYPAEIERVLLADPRVADAAVVRRPDERWGEVPVAFVAPRDASLDEASLRARCREQLAGYKQPGAFRFIALEEFPRSASGKIQRHELERRLGDP